MKRRNLLLAFALIGLFLGAGRFYFRSYVRQKPFAIILFVAEGLTPAKLAAARQYSGGADFRLSIESLPRLALLRNAAADFAVPDSAAAASAIATGNKTGLRSLGIDLNNKSVGTLVDLASNEGRATGLVTNAWLTDAGAAAFYAKSRDARETENIAAQLTANDKLDLIVGGGAVDFRGTMKGGRRQDARDLDLEMQRAGFTLARNAPDLDGIAAWKLPRVLGLLADEEIVGPGAPSLPDLVRRAIELLQVRPRGYLLIVYAGQIERASRANESERMLQQLVELDRAVAVARQYAGEKAMLIVAGLQETGGFTMNGYPLRTDKGVALLGINPTSNLPSFTWATGPNGRQDTDGMAKSDPAAAYSLTAVGATSDVLAFGIGQGSETLSGVLDNTAVFEIIRLQL